MAARPARSPRIAARWGGAFALLVSLTVAVAGSNPANAAGYAVSVVDTAGSPGWHTSIQLDAAGNPVVAYQEALSNDLRILHCDDRACSGDGDTINTLVTTNNDGQYASLQLDAGGNPVVAFYDASVERLRVLHCDDPGCAPGGDTLATPDTATAIGRFASLVLDGAGNPVISYRDDNTLDLKLLHCDDPACLPGPGDTITSPDTDGNVGWYTSLQLDAAGNPVVSHHSQSDGDLRLLHCDDPACAPGGDTVTTPATDGNTGRFTSLELDATGNPAVSFFDVAETRIRVLRCDDPGCAPGGDTVESPDPLSGVGGYTSLELDSAGNPIVSYFDHQRFDLRVARCNDPACSGGNEFVEAPDAAGSAGEWTSLALDADDKPIVVYRSESAQGLKIAAFGGVGYPLPACALGWWSGDGSTAASFGPDLEGAVGYAEAVSGSGFALDGDDSLVVDALPEVSTGVSVEMWVRPTQTGLVQALLSRWNAPSSGEFDRAFILTLDPGGRLAWSTDEDSTLRPRELVAERPDLFDGSFHHVAATWAAAGTMTLYIDGVQVASQTAQRRSLNPATATQFRLGSKSGGQPFFFTGLIDEPAVYGCALTADDVEGIYLVGAAGKA